MRLGYRRLSSEQQTDGLSLEAQKEILKRAECDRIYTDIESGWSGRGGESSDREQFQVMLADARDLRRDGHDVEIVFPEFSRWARNTLTSMDLIEQLEEEGVTLRSMDTGPISVKTAGQWLNSMQQSVMAEYYSRQLSDKIQRTYTYKRATGRPLQHKAPFGWQLSKDRTKLEPNLAPFKDSGLTHWQLARRMMELYMDGNSFGSVAKSAQGLGLDWVGSVLRKWMLNPIHQGHTWWYKTKIKKGDYRKKGVNDEKEIIYNTHEALITPAEFERILQRISEGKQNWGVNAGLPINVLQSLAFCKECGGKLKRSPNPTTLHPNYAYMRCFSRKCSGRNFPFHKIEQALIDAIVAHAAEVAKRAAIPDARKKSAKLIQLEADRLDLLELLARRESPGLQQALEEIEAEIKKFDTPKAAGPSLESVSKMIEAIEDPEMFELLSQRELRTIFVALVERVVVDVSPKRMADRKITEIIMRF